ncbi:hypothetical protein [Nocardiopsis baichengensis]|uniref:hypothetical protein n=1 Tax=Nocardiopsis baichengensis TaxID=280240 RepID=UPI00034BCA41|nr:hypothetical protein [Nocardiopsis baichengensis]
MSANAPTANKTSPAPATGSALLITAVAALFSSSLFDGGLQIVLIVSAIAAVFTASVIFGRNARTAGKK